jgi:hypothetical protein
LPSLISPILEPRANILKRQLSAAGNRFFSVEQNGSLQVYASAGLLTAATDTDPTTPPDPDTLSVGTLIESPKHGSVSINNADGSFTYTPDSGFVGPDYFTWQVDDGSKQGDYATAFIDVQPVTAGVALTVGGYTSPPPNGATQDTPIIPIDDGYDSDTQSVPNNQLPVPDLIDPELVPASVQLTVPGGLTATWSLNFPSAVRVFMLKVGTLTPVSAGQQFTYDPTGVEGPSDTQYQFEMQGVSAASPAAITAMMTPAGNPETQASVNAPVVPKALQVLSVKDNTPGAVLTPAQQQAGVFLPISNPGPKNVGGIVYKLPIVIHDLSVNARLTVPDGWIVLDENGTPQPTAGGGLLLKPAPASDTKLFIEATSGNAAVTLTLNQVNKQGQSVTPDGFKYPLLGTVVVTPFKFSGPTDVPQYGQYEYKLAAGTIKGGKWLAPNQAAGTMTVPDQTKPDDVMIQWNAGAQVGKAVFQANAQYVWDLSVNVFKIEVAAPANVKTGAVVGKILATTIDIRSDGLSMKAHVTVTGPDGQTGLKHLTVGFVQNLSPQTTRATYQIPLNAPQTLVMYSKSIGPNGARLESNPNGNPLNFWDSQFNVSPPFYSNADNALLRSSQLLKSASGDIFTVDAPAAVFPLEGGKTGKGNGNIISDTVAWNLIMSVVAVTDEANNIYASQAYLPWVFNGSGRVGPNANGVNTWTGNGAATTFLPTPATQFGHRRTPRQPRQSQADCNSIPSCRHPQTPSTRFRCSGHRNGRGSQ